jgi:protein-S-isoprenylcysteine O-methyltransferase Ste14
MELMPALKIGTGIFCAGIAVVALGLLGLITAIVNFGTTPVDQPVTKGLYRVSRHPQIVSLTVIFLGICLMIGSWAALLALAASRVLQHYGILGEEEACLAEYGESYRAYLERVPRYFLFF